MSATIPRLAWPALEKRLEAGFPGRRIPLSGAFELTYRCNFRCVHCYLQNCRRQAELPTAKWCSLLDEVARAGTLLLTLTGGEPFLHDGFDEIYERAVRAGFLVTVFTNGSSLTARRVAWLRRRPARSIEVTLYGFSPETYARVTGSGDDFRRAVDGVRRAARAGLPVQVKTMVFDETRAEFEDIRSFAQELGLTFRFDPFLHGALGRTSAPLRHRLDPEESVALVREDPAALSTLAKRVAAFRKTDDVYVCGAGRRAFSIAPDGALQLCTLVRSTRFDLASMSFEEAWKALGREVGRRYVSPKAACANCSARPVCGSCPGIAELETGDSEAPVQYLCDIAHRVARQLPQAVVDE